MVQRKNEQLLSKNILMHPLMQGRDSQTRTCEGRFV